MIITSQNKYISYIQVTNENLETAYNIQKEEWKKSKDRENFIDKVMHVKENYTEENKDEDKPTLIYTYNFTDKTELWNNRYLGLNEYYDKCNK